MSKVQLLRALVNQRLTAAAEEIIGLFERTIAEYEEELCRSKEENERQRKLLDTVFSPRVRLHRAEACFPKHGLQNRDVCSSSGLDPTRRTNDGGYQLVVPADVQQLLVKKEEVPSEQQEDKPEPPHIKEKEEGEQLQGLKEADITKFTFTAVPVKSDEDDGEKPQSSQLHQTQTEQKKTEADGDDCGGAEPIRKSDPERHLQPDAESGDSDDDWTESRKTRRGLNSVKNKKVPVRDGGRKLENSHFQCSECGKCFDSKGKLKLHTRVHTGEKPFSCLFCGKRFSQKGNSIGHMRIHTGEKPFSCLICKRSFRYSGDVSRHMRIHTQRRTFTTDSSIIHTAPGLARGFNPHRPSQQGT